MSSAGWIMSFVFEFEAYCVKGQAAHAKASVAAESGPPKRRPTSQSPSDAEEVPEDRGRMRGRQRVPLAAPAEQPVAGQVGLVGDRAVGVALGVGGLAAAVGLDAVADLAGGVGGPAGGTVPLDREVAVRALRRVAIRSAPITPE